MKTNEKLKNVHLEIETLLLKFQEETGICISELRISPCFRLGKKGVSNYQIETSIRAL